MTVATTANPGDRRSERSRCVASPRSASNPPNPAARRVSSRRYVALPNRRRAAAWASDGARLLLRRIELEMEAHLVLQRAIVFGAARPDAQPVAKTVDE